MSTRWVGLSDRLLAFYFKAWHRHLDRRQLGARVIWSTRPRWRCDRQGCCRARERVERPASS